MTRKSGKHLCVTYGTLNSCFDLIASHHQYIFRLITSFDLIASHHHWRSNHSMQKPELYHWATG